jgi:hypothetical protein
VKASAPGAYVSNDKLHKGRGRFNQARNAAGLPKAFRFHDLRVTCLTNVGIAGATSYELMLYGGHDDMATVVRYQVSGQERLRALGEKKSPDLGQVASVSELPKRDAV